jgi:GNAT superfamily N-acetyltransferase
MGAWDLEIRPADAKSGRLAGYSRLLSDVFGEGPKFTETAIAWRYRDNPVGTVVGADAWDGERLAAHYAVCPLEAVIEGRVIRGLLSLNTATHPDYQGRGLFSRLAESAYAQGAAAGYEFVVGVANANSTPGFLRRLGFQDCGRLEAGILGRRPKDFLDRPVQFQGSWRNDTLAWRLANPAGRYLSSHSGALTAVWARTHLPFVRCGAFLAAMPEHTTPPAPSPLCASLFIGLEPRLDLARQGFWPVPERFRPSPLNLIWRRLGSSAPAQLERQAAAISFLDFDPY